MIACVLGVIGFFIGGWIGAIFGVCLGLAFYEFCMSGGTDPGFGSFIAFIIGLCTYLSNQGVEVGELIGRLLGGG